MHALIHNTWQFYREKNIVIILELYRMLRSTFIYDFHSFNKYECSHYMSVLSIADIMSYNPLTQGKKGDVAPLFKERVVYRNYRWVNVLLSHTWYDIYHEVRTECYGNTWAKQLKPHNHHAKKQKLSSLNVKLSTPPSELKWRWDPQSEKTLASGQLGLTTLHMPMSTKVTFTHLSTADEPGFCPLEFWIPGAITLRRTFPRVYI